MRGGELAAEHARRAHLIVDLGAGPNDQRLAGRQVGNRPRAIGLPVGRFDGCLDHINDRLRVLQRLELLHLHASGRIQARRECGDSCERTERVRLRHRRD